MKRVVVLGLVMLLATMAVVPTGQAKVLNENPTDAPPGCDGIQREESITVRGGREFGQPFPGAVFTFDDRVYEIPPCTKLNVTFVNEDDIRHQWMAHGAFPAGFFLIEVDGPGQDSGEFITGPNPSTLLVHCGLPQHQQKGMKAQMKVAGGDGTLPNILGVSGIPGDGAETQREGLFEVLPWDPVTPMIALAGAAALLAARRRD